MTAPALASHRPAISMSGSAGVIGFAALLSAQPAAAGTLASDTPLWDMFIAADWVVRAVTTGLAAAFAASLAAFAAKSLELRKCVAAHRAALARLEGADGLAEADESAGPARFVRTAILATRAEIERSRGALHDVAGLKERIASRLDRIEAAEMRRIQCGAGFLATVGAAAPFAGLFGAVWSVMNAALGAAASRTTDLTMLAPTVGEALLAAGLGLAAAITAVVARNHLAAQISGYRALIGDITASLLRLVSRDVSRRRADGQWLPAE